MAFHVHGLTQLMTTARQIASTWESKPLTDSLPGTLQFAMVFGSLLT